MFSFYLWVVNLFIHDCYRLNVNLIWVAIMVFVSCPGCTQGIYEIMFLQNYHIKASHLAAKAVRIIIAKQQSRTDVFCLKRLAYYPLSSSFQKLNIPCLELEIPNIIRLILRHYERELVFVNKVRTFSRFPTNTIRLMTNKENMINRRTDLNFCRSIRKTGMTHH